MDDPMKIIHKYKNNNGRIQYHIHIFIGDIIDDNCLRVLKKIKDLDLYNTLTTLDEKEREILKKNYGDYWYEKFFNSYHITSIKESVIHNPSKLRELKNLLGSEWVNDHFINYRRRLQVVTYSYEAMVKEERERKMIKKIIQRQQNEAEELMDYTTLGKVSLDLARIIQEEDKSINMSGGQEPIEEETIDTGFEYAGEEFDMNPPGESALVEELDEQIAIDLADTDLLFGELDDADQNVKLTTKELKEAISQETYENISRKIAEFDQSKDNSMFDENLKDAYHKNYITHQYIFKDDTIKTIHNKICCAFKNNNKFGENTYIIPSYQHLWTEYFLNERTEKVMIGKKWIVKNDILKLDVEPNNNLSVYEDLRGNLKVLRDNIRRQGKIKVEDDESGIFYDYEGYYTFNEIFLVDIYNELGMDYDSSFEERKNLMDVYVKIYYPKIKPDDLNNIIDFLKRDAPENKKVIERNKLKTIFSTINNDLILENEIMRDIELVKKRNKKDYKKIFQENYVNQSVIRAYLSDKYQKINLFRIFDNFILSDEYPFIQYQPIDGSPRYRYNEKYLMENEKKEIIMKWFENSPYGISFKMRVSDKSDYKYMAINLSDNGKIDYKIQWKEEDMSTVDDIKDTYQHIRRLIEKINYENEKFHIKLNVPFDDDFKFAFINTIQRFELPENFVINHNDLSEFSRYFFPYVALVIEPRKRQSKVRKIDKDEKSKFGTYLRYKRVSKYENRAKIEHSIIFFMRNYEYDDQSLANEISKEFNITIEQAIIEINNVRNKYPNIKKSRKILKKMEDIPKRKPPGIGVDIQGKTRNKYKMRIAGARSREQLDRIIEFMNILIYLYIETYLYKKPERQRMKDKLKRLTKIAKRRNKVDEIVNQETTVKNVKQMTSIDKRLSYKAEEDQNQWTRDCQNSGTDKQRRPQQFLNADELTKLGYVWVEKLGELDFGHYERKVLVDKDGRVDSNKKKTEVTLRAVKLPLDDSGENFVYYTCGPEENGKHMYIGFLSKSKNPYGEPMPCCFIKDHFLSNNKEKRNFYLRSIGLLRDEEGISKVSGDQLYILQDSNKIPESRFAFLPKYLDIFLNFMLNKERKIKNHYLLSAPNGYYFKYGTRQDEYKYLSALCALFDTNINDLKAKLVKTMEGDRNLHIFTSLNNGDIRTQFGTIEAYISYLKNNEYLEYELLNDLLCLPGVLRKHGINILIFQKKVKIIRKSLEREKIKESYYVVCQNNENINDLKDPRKETVMIIKENKNYFPIIMVTKESEATKEVTVTKTFVYEDSPINVIHHIFKYYQINCQSEFRILINEQGAGSYNAKETYLILNSIGKNEYQPKSQIIDARFKCKYLITQAGYLVPTMPSGSIYHLHIASNTDHYLKDYQTTVNYLIDLDLLTNSKLKMKPIGVFYREKNKNYLVTAIMTESYDSVPILEKSLSPEFIKKEKLLIQNRPTDEIIDQEIAKGVSNYQVDDRIYYVAKNNYEVEMYQLFRLHLSYYLNYIPNGQKLKEKLVSIIESTHLPKRQKKLEIKKLLYQMTSPELARTFGELVRKYESSKTGKGGSAVHQPVQEVQIIPTNVFASKVYPTETDTNVVSARIEFNDPTPPKPDVNTSYPFTKNKAPAIEDVHFPPEEKAWINVFPETKEIDYPSFVVRNNRELCYHNLQKDSCQYFKHCHWMSTKNICLLSVRKDLLIDFVNQVAEEFTQNELKAHEILRKDEYFVSDIVNYNIFTERPGERIIVSSNTNLNKILAEIFGKANIPVIGKRRNKVESIQNYDQLNYDNPMKEIGNWYLQNVIENNNTIFRAFANTYFWLLHPYNESTYRNLGYYSHIQTNLANIYKSQVVDWLLDKQNEEEIKKIISYVKYGKISEFATKLSIEVYNHTNCIIELFVLSRLYETLVNVYDENFHLIYVIHPHDGIVYDYKTAERAFNKYQDFKKVIHLRFHNYSRNIYPDKIEAMYPKN